jgi:4-carboxymuconolactone decarboxylase
MMSSARYPTLAPSEMTAAQLAVHDELVSGPRGTADGPFAALLRIPEVLGPLQRAGAALRFDGSLDREVFEFAVLLVARHWNQAFEWSVHSEAALRAGVPRTVVAALAGGSTPADLEQRFAVAADVFEQLTRGATVDDDTFRRASAALGTAGVVELVTVFGYYTTLAFVLNTADVRASFAPTVALGHPPASDGDPMAGA